jgi:hypothetical protein
MTLKNRVAILERANTETDEGGYFDLPPVMAYDEWCEAAAKQQAELIKETHEKT